MKPQAKLLRDKSIQLLMLTSSQLSLIGASNFHGPQEKATLESSRPLLIHSKALDDSIGTKSSLKLIRLLTTTQPVLPSSFLDNQSVKESKSQWLQSKLMSIIQDKQEKLLVDNHGRELIELLNNFSTSGLILTPSSPMLAQNIQSIQVQATTTVRPVYYQIPRPILSHDISEMSILPTSVMAYARDLSGNKDQKKRSTTE